mgnify:FL=1
MLLSAETEVRAAVIDNASDDPTTIPTKTGTGSLLPWVEAATHDNGAHGNL